MIISCDPGVANFGLSVIDNKEEYRVLETYLVKNNRKFTDEEKEIELVYGARTVKVLAVINKLKEVLTRYTIDSIVVEAPFYNTLTPMAFSSLVEVISVLKYNIAVENNIKFYSIEPLLVKKLFTKHHLASKQAIKEFLISKVNDKIIILDDKIDITQLSEHEIDSIAVGYSFHITSGTEQNKE